MHGIAALQPYVIGIFLLWASLMKLLSSRMRAQAGRTALARLTGPARAVPALRLAGALELIVAAALLLPPVLPVEGVAAAALSTGFLAYLTYARFAAPATSCGCLGTHSRPVDGRAFARAGLLLAASITAIWAAPAGPKLALTADPTLALTGGSGLGIAGGSALGFMGGPALALMGVAEIAVLLALSSELDRYWLMPLRRLTVRVRKPLAVAPSPGGTPLEITLRLLYLSPAYCSTSASLTSDVQDAWEDDGLRFVAYATHGGTAVFAVPLSGDDPATIRVALVPEPALT